MSVGQLDHVTKPKAIHKYRFVNSVSKKWISDRISQIEINRDFDVPLIAARSKECRVIYIDRALPVELEAASRRFDPTTTIPWHEVPEWFFMHRLGLEFEDAHSLAVHEFERPTVEAMGLDWPAYQEIMRSEASANERRYKNRRLAPISDLDLEPYFEEKATWAIDALGAQNKFVDHDLEGVKIYNSKGKLLSKTDLLKRSAKR